MIFNQYFREKAPTTSLSLIMDQKDEQQVIQVDEEKKSCDHSFWARFSPNILWAAVVLLAFQMSFENTPPTRPYINNPESVLYPLYNMMAGLEMIENMLSMIAPTVLTYLIYSFIFPLVFRLAWIRSSFHSFVSIFLKFLVLSLIATLTYYLKLFLLAIIISGKADRCQIDAYDTGCIQVILTDIDNFSFYPPTFSLFMFFVLFSTTIYFNIESSDFREIIDKVWRLCVLIVCGLFFLILNFGLFAYTLYIFIRYEFIGTYLAQKSWFFIAVILCLMINHKFNSWVPMILKKKN